jgi:tRNA(adenine34) deaminase
MSASAAVCSLFLIPTRVPANAALAALKARAAAIAMSFFIARSPSVDLGARLRQCQSTIHMATIEHLQFMAEAVAEARRAEAEGEVPVGAIAVADGQIVGAGHNRPIGLRDPTAHAEILAIRAAASALKTYRLTAVSIYVTLEPCVMCVGAMLNARIARVVYGARDDKAGALGSVYDIGRDGRLNHRFEVIGGVMESECAELIREFFRARRGGA